MIRAEFYAHKGSMRGFRISGHAGYAESGSDVVCAAVSSAVQLTANLLDEFGCEPVLDVEDNVIKCIASAQPETSSRIIRQLRLHLEAVLEEFPKTIKITISEV